MESAGLSAEKGGVFVITVTPFRENGEVDFDSARQMVDFFCGLGVHGLTILGVAGEASKMTEAECESFAALVDQINLVTEMASEPATAADGRRKSADINPELTALSGDIDAGALAAASEKDQLRREIADQLEKLLPPA